MKKFIQTIRNIYKIEDLRKRILYTIGIILIYRLGAYIVLPGVDPSMLANLQNQTKSRSLGPSEYVLRRCIFQCLYFRTWDHALHLCIHRDAAAWHGHSIFPETSERG